MSGNETFATRWNRRKLEAKREADAAADISRDAVAAPEGARHDATAEAVDTTPLPSLDDITPSGDVTAFLKQRVPAELQKLALRRAWASDPVISGFVEVAENQWDWNVPGLGPPGFGPLDPSWNVAELLAQATGTLPTAPAQPVVDGGCDKTTHSPAIPSESFDAQPAVAVRHEPGTEIVTPVAGVESGSADRLIAGLNPTPCSGAEIDRSKKSQPLAMHHTQGLPRRRHGGALPNS